MTRFTSDQERWADVPDDTLLEAAVYFESHPTPTSLVGEWSHNQARRMRAEVERRTVALAERDGTGEALGRSANGAVDPVSAERVAPSAPQRSGASVDGSTYSESEA